MPTNTNVPRDIRIAESQHPDYAELTEDASSPFSHIQKKDLFIFAMGYGFDQGLRTSVESSTRALFNADSLTNMQTWTMRAIAVHEAEDHTVLRDPERVYTIAQEYAHGGMNQLHSVYTRPGDTFSDLSTEIVQYGEQRLDI